MTHTPGPEPPKPERWRPPPKAKAKPAGRSRVRPLAGYAVIPEGKAVDEGVLKAAAAGTPFTAGAVVATATGLSRVIAELRPGEVLVLWKLPARAPGNPRALTPEQDAQIARMLAQDVAPAAVAAHFGVDVTTVTRAARRHTGRPPGLPGHPRGLTGAQAAEAKRLHGEGMNWSELERRYGRARITVKRAVERLGKDSTEGGEGE